jgi:tetratricopeptide (TPR) repeat protein
VYLGNAKKLIKRLARAASERRKICFLVGSGLSMQVNGQNGVPTALQIVGLVKTRLESDEIEDLENEIAVTQIHPYQQAMQYLLTTNGPDVVNRVVQEAVLQAHLNPPAIASLTDDLCGQLELDLSNWCIPRGLESLARILANAPNQSNAILTTNFDPLIEIALRKAGADATPVPLSNDGAFGAVGNPSAKAVIHLHGYWYGQDTLHTPDQITRDRPQLEGALRRLLANSMLVVIGYGGWSDVFTRTLVRLAAEVNESMETLWCFYEKDSATITNNHSALLASFGSALGKRIIPYAGIDCNVVLPELEASITPQLPSRESVETNSVVVVVRQVSSEHVNAAPTVDAFVGREVQLGQLEASDATVISVCGMGGQGKSYLVSKYLRSLPPGTHTVWCDCKEQQYRLSTQLLSIVRGLSLGTRDLEEIEQEGVEAVIAIIRDKIASSGVRWSIVLDNVDQYIDVEAKKAIHGLEHLVNSMLGSSSDVQFILTSRPSLQYEHPRFLSIPLVDGLSGNEVKQLVDMRIPELDSERRESLARRTHQVTAGHPLCVGILLAQLKAKPAAAEAVFERITATDAASLVGQMLTSVIETLTPKQRVLLSIISETVRPETEARLTEISEYHQFTHNQFGRAFSALRNCHLLIAKQPPNSARILYTVHPLVQAHVRGSQPLKVRSQVIDAVLSVYRKYVGKRRDDLSSSPPLSMIEWWTQKAELEGNSGKGLLAAKTLAEISTVVLDEGYLEEYVRVALPLFEDWDWSRAGDLGELEIHDAFSTLTACLWLMGDFVRARRFLDGYEHAIPRRSATFIRYCELRCDCEWHAKCYDFAILWGERGRALQRELQIDECAPNLTHSLALAQRDSGRFNEAETYFLFGREWADVLGDYPIEGWVGHHYGNLGRCKYLQGEYDEALKCMFRSFVLLEVSEVNSHGFAALWIAEALKHLGNLPAAFRFALRAAECWGTVSPRRAHDVGQLSNEIREQLSADLCAQLEATPRWERDVWIRNFVEGNLSPAWRKVIPV